MDIGIRLERLKLKVEQEREKDDFPGRGYSPALRRAVVKVANEAGVKRVTDVLGISSPTIYGWRNQAVEVESDEGSELAVTRVSVQPTSEETEPEVVARFWIGETAVDIFSTEVVFEIARRSLGAKA